MCGVTVAIMAVDFPSIF